MTGWLWSKFGVFYTSAMQHSSSVFEKQIARWQRKKSREPEKQREIRAVKGWEIKTKEANGQQKTGDEVDLPASPRK
jgi:hypothetical protein